MERLPDELLPWLTLFRGEGITKVRDLTLSLDAWRGDQRLQIRCDSNPQRLGDFIFEQDFENGVPVRILRPGTHLAERPDNPEFDILAGWMFDD
jgi:hypothetical protein